MNLTSQLNRIFLYPLVMAACCTLSVYGDFDGRHVTLTGESATGFTYMGTGVDGLPGTTDPDSRRRPKIYNDFAAFDASSIGSSLSLTYDILLGGDADPGNESQDWRFGFVSTNANGSQGVTLGANFDIGDLAGSTAYEFFTDSAVTTGDAGSGEMDSAFTATLNAGQPTARFAQSNNDPFGDDVALNDRVDTNRITLNLERIMDGYELSMTWQNLTSMNTIDNSTTITTADFDPAVALAAGVTSWDRVGFFINDDSLDASGGPYVYSMSNVAVAGNAAALGLNPTWSANAYQTVPEPGALWMIALGLIELARDRSHPRLPAADLKMSDSSSKLERSQARPSYHRCRSRMLNHSLVI